MNRFFSTSAMLAIAASTTVITSCSHETDYYNPNAAVEAYEKNWENEFGTIDSNQDWNTAASRVADITVDGTATVRIQTGNPYLNEGCLAAEFTVNSHGTFNFDLPKSSSCVYFVLRDDNGKNKEIKTVYLNDNTFTADFSSASAASAKSARTRATRTATEFTNVTKASYFAQLWYDGDYNSWDYSYNTKYYNKWNDKYYNVSYETTEKPTIDQSLLSAIKEIIPENQKSSYYSTIIKDVDLVVKEDGPVKLTVASATTSNQAAIGYYIYEDKQVTNSYDCPVTLEYLQNNGYTSSNKYTIDYNPTTDAQKLADKFVIIPNVQNFKEETTTQYYPEKITTVTGKSITLLYPNGDGTYTEDFPAGTKIAFFVIPNANYNNNSIDVQKTAFSFADMNVDVHKTGYYYYSNFDDSNYATSHAATFKLQDKIIIGFEDAGYYSSTDYDYNDCVFILDGNFDEDEIPDPIEPEEPEMQTWTVACEDLGSTDDFDFNDVVFKVGHVSGKDTITVTPLAAGGTLGSTIYLNETEVGEIHQLLNPNATVSSSYEMLNTSSKDYTGSDITLPVSSDFSITENMGGFSIKVSNGSTATTITAPEEGEAPQMILIEGDWAWPKERVNIESAYPNFANWNKNAGTNLDWYKSYTEGTVIK